MDKKHERRKAVVIEYLEQRGYPNNIEAETVIELLPEIWKELDKQALIPEGMKYEEFYFIAFENYMFQKLANEIGL